MRHLSHVCVGLLMTCAATAGVHPVALGPAPADGNVAQSAALFVGVRKFNDATLADVQYAADDAVDLAAALSLDEKTRLVKPERVVIALSGDPQKHESQLNLVRLRSAGARITTAGQSDVLLLLEQQARTAGRDGILIVALATHGVSEGGTQYLLTATSLLRYRETTLSEPEVREIASRSEARRSLILIDACRARLTTGAREGSADPRSAAALLRSLGAFSGQVVFSAAAAGDYAYDDVDRRNGVFTAAVIDGLRCQADTDAQGFVTVDTLHRFVEHRVLSWVRRNRDPNAQVATQLDYQGGASAMPLSQCAGQRHGVSASASPVPTLP